jgi:hypothetical protein
MILNLQARKLLRRAFKVVQKLSLVNERSRSVSECVCERDKILIEMEIESQ